MTFWDSVMKEIFPWILATALLLAGSAFLYAGVKLTSTAWTLKTSGEQTTATCLLYTSPSPRD